MIILIDESVRGPVTGRLRRDGHTVFRVKDLLPSAPDDELPALAVSLSALFITADKGFGHLAFVMRSVSAGVLLIRLAEMSAQARADRVTQVIAEHGPRLLRPFTVVRANSVRMRELPANGHAR